MQASAMPSQFRQHVAKVTCQVLAMLPFTPVFKRLRGLSLNCKNVILTMCQYVGIVVAWDSRERLSALVIHNSDKLHQMHHRLIELKQVLILVINEASTMVQSQSLLCSH